MDGDKGPASHPQPVPPEPVLRLHPASLDKKVAQKQRRVLLGHADGRLEKGRGFPAAHLVGSPALGGGRSCGR